MSNVAHKLELGEATQETATVVRREGATLVVRTFRGTARASRAVSCVVDPEPGDLVLVAALASGAAYVLAVLEREAGAKVAFVADGDLELRAASGKVSVAGKEGVTVASSADVRILAAKLDVRAAEGNVVLDKLALLGRSVLAEVETVKTLATALDSIATRISQRVKRSYRIVEESDQVRAARIDYEAKESLQLHAHDALVTAEGLVKVDGDQIHLG